MAGPSSCFRAARDLRSPRGALHSLERLSERVVLSCAGESGMYATSRQPWGVRDWRVTLGSVGRYAPLAAPSSRHKRPPFSQVRVGLDTGGRSRVFVGSTPSALAAPGRSGFRCHGARRRAVEARARTFWPLGIDGENGVTLDGCTPQNRLDGPRGGAAGAGGRLVGCAGIARCDREENSYETAGRELRGGGVETPPARGFWGGAGTRLSGEEFGDKKGKTGRR